MQQRPSQQLWGGDRAPPAPPGQVIQITVVAAGGGLTGGGPEMVQLFALLNDGSIWRLQEWRPGAWEEISLPARVTQAGSEAVSEALRLAQEESNRRQAREGWVATGNETMLPDPAEGRRIVPGEPMMVDSSKTSTPAAAVKDATGGHPGGARPC